MEKTYTHPFPMVFNYITYKRYSVIPISGPHKWTNSLSNQVVKPTIFTNQPVKITNNTTDSIVNLLKYHPNAQESLVITSQQWCCQWLKMWFSTFDPAQGALSWLLQETDSSPQNSSRSLEVLLGTTGWTNKVQTPSIKYHFNIENQ